MKKTGNKSTDTETKINAEALQNMERDATEHGVTFTQAGLENLLKPADENNVVETATREEVIRKIAGIEPDTAPTADAVEQNDGKEIYSVEQQLECLAIAKVILEHFGSLEQVCVKAFMQCQRELRLHMHRSLKQTTIKK